MKKVMYILALLLTLLPEVAHAESPEVYAQRLYRLLTGIPLMAENPLYPQIMNVLGSNPGRGQLLAAAAIITGGRSGGAVTGAREFYDVTLANFAASWNRDESQSFEVNELTAMIVGSTLDDQDIRSLLTDDFTYAETNLALVNNTAARSTNNNHFAEIRRRSTFLSPTFTRQTRSVAFAADGDAFVGAGVFASRPWGENYYLDGTNRRPWVGILNNLYCIPIDGIKNSNVPSLYVRRDVSRAPGGDPASFINNCRGCHGVMDSVTRAFAFSNFRGGKTRQNGNIPNKVNGNGATEAAPEGFRVTTDDWTLEQNEEQNQILGFPSDVKSGKGIRALGEAIGSSDGFYNCMAKRVVSQLYMKKAFSVSGQNDADKRRLLREDARIKQFARALKSHHNLKTLFEEVAVEYVMEVKQ